MIRMGILSTFPPTQCGLATFSRSLMDGLNALPVDAVQGVTAGVVAVVDQPDDGRGPEVAHEWLRSDPNGAHSAARALNGFDVAIVQHEFGIFGGRDGADVLDLVRALRVPIIVVLHTVLVTPTVRQRSIIEELVRSCAEVVVMTQTARQRLVEHYAVDETALHVIPHGAADNSMSGTGRRPSSERPVILTWGLLGAGKGIEWAIEAMTLLRDLVPAPSYRVVGQTHPRVAERQGELYRDELIARARRLGVSDAVHFDGRYLDAAELKRVVQQADIVLLPYDSVDQVTSGVLIEAVTAGKPVVSTAFPHACELLATGAGIVVERQDPTALAAALRRVLTEPGLSGGMSAEARRLAPGLLWPAVAAQYGRLAERAVITWPVRATA